MMWVRPPPLRPAYSACIGVQIAIPIAMSIDAIIIFCFQKCVNALG